MIEHYCTYFNARYLARGLALFQSLVHYQSGEFVLWVLCLDDETYAVLQAFNLPHLRPVRLSELEAADPDLLRVKPTRSAVEYFFTCSPAWTLYVLEQHPEIERLTYLDSDMLMFSSPQPIFDELAEASIGIIAHRFPPHLQHLELYGRYNVGWLTFCRDENALACLRWWREKCIEWCYDRLEGDRFADQKYLDQWHDRFKGVKTLEHKGANTAPWNWMQYAITQRNGALYIDNDPLIIFHYQGLKLFNRWLYDPGYWQYSPVRLPAQQLIYGPYIAALHDAKTWLRTVAPAASVGYTGVRSRTYGMKTFILRMVRGQIVPMLPPL